MKIKWQALSKPGTECLLWQESAQGLWFQGIVNAQSSDQASFELNYSIRCDANWYVRTCDLQIGLRTLQLRSNGQGQWHDGNGQPLLEFAGCYDVDISATPFTNTLPIRRLQLLPDQPATLITVVYIKVPELTLELQQQRYRWHKTTDGTAVIQYENLTSGYAAELLVDADGLVLTYPNLFQRI